MSICGKDNLQTRRTLNVGDKSYDYYSLKVLPKKSATFPSFRLR